ncbi:hypothetical protein [Devosia sp. LjRoot3]|uniref:hypothetical protein n=1 Tax=Devosia sp. LjRoot3 TaxID=3342319 RepID=UPI003ED09C27
MDRTLDVQVDRTTWPGAPTYKSYPPAFMPTKQSWTANIPDLLLTIGYLTTPSHASGVSLSEFWAWVRYLHAVSSDSDLRLSRAFFELDSHQKTILSDDFGMGAPMYWLTGKLGLTQIVDGRYFIDRMAAQVGASKAATLKKRGPTKSSDFVARDANGKWHVIECKGTQTGTGYRDSQLGSALPFPKGAVAQKRTVAFPQNKTGQILAAGLFLGVENGRYASDMRVIDPPGEDPFKVGPDDIEFADDAATRSTGAKALRLAGFPAISSAVSAPSGHNPAERAEENGQRERQRRETVEGKRANAEEEFKNRTGRKRMVSDGRTYRGRQVEVPLPTPIHIGKRQINSILLRYGVSSTFLDELREHPVVEDQIQKMVPAVVDLASGIRLEGDATGGSMHIGESFLADMTFKT